MQGSALLTQYFLLGLEQQNYLGHYVKNGYPLTNSGWALCYLPENFYRLYFSRLACIKTPDAGKFKTQFSAWSQDVWLSRVVSSCILYIWVTPQESQSLLEKNWPRKCQVFMWSSKLRKWDLFIKFSSTMTCKDFHFYLLSLAYNLSNRDIHYRRYYTKPKPKEKTFQLSKINMWLQEKNRKKTKYCVA